MKALNKPSKNGLPRGTSEPTASKMNSRLLSQENIRKQQSRRKSDNLGRNWGPAPRDQLVAFLGHSDLVYFSPPTEAFTSAASDSNNMKFKSDLRKMSSPGKIEEKKMNSWFSSDKPVFGFLCCY
eukprot:GHVL01018438.1.p1 GENE.GHVL01018438.1~~GHVL01018438.1.p1  ORF type:complete len:125 (+),score=25.34 GHVL01018438.1:28-402(+)